MNFLTSGDSWASDFYVTVYDPITEGRFTTVTAT
jgi:hypothetical protein